MKRLFILFIVLLMPCGAVFSQKKDTYKVRTIVIDPGHGGAKPGAQGSRSFEKAITLSVAKKFGKLIHDNYPDVKVIYTRTTDVDISLAERARIANRNKADLFISIHANSHPTTVPNGVETFVMGLSESKANLEVAKKENADILLEADYKDNADYSVFDPNSPESYVLLTMFQNAYLEKSLNFAQAIQSQYMRNIKTINRGVKQAELFVLYKTTCPSVLTEIGFISNPKEEAFMLSDEGQAKIAISLFNAFMNYKATEEGSNKPYNPKIDLPGYKSPSQDKTAAPKEEPKPEVAAKEEPVKEEPEAEKPAPVQPIVAESQPTQPAETTKPVETVETVKPAEPVAQPAKPTPTVELPPQTAHQEAPVSKAEPTPEPAPQPAVTAEEPVQTPAKPAQETLTAPNNTADSNATSYYTVQFLSSPKLYKAGAPTLDGISEFKVTHKNKSYAYSTGRFATFQEAVDYCAHIHRTTRFRDAWAYLYKVPVQAEPKSQQATTGQPTTADNQNTSKLPTTANTQADTAKQSTPAPQKAVDKSGLKFRVQFLTASRRIKVGASELQGIKDIHYSPSGRYFIYSAGDYKTLQEAQKRCDAIRTQTTFKDAHVIALYNGERITLERAAEIQKRNKR